MNRRILCAATWACLLAMGAVARAQPDPTTQPKRQPVKKPAKAKAADETDAVPKPLIDAARRSFVVVKIHFQRDTSETSASTERDYRIGRLYEEYVDRKRPAEVPGIVLDDDGHVLVVDGGLEDRFIRRIEVVSGGKTYEARRAKLLLDAPGIVLKVDAPAGRLKGVSFARLEDKGVNTALVQASLQKADEQWRLRFTPLRPSVAFDPADGENIFFGYRMPSRYGSAYGGGMGDPEGAHGMGLLADTKGRCVGCVLTPFIDLQQTEVLWKGPDLLAAKGLDWEKFAQAEKTHQARLTRATHEVVLVLRQGAGETERYSLRTGSAAGREVSTHGLAIGPREVLVPKRLDSKMAGDIERIYIKHYPTQRQEVQFVGAFKEIGAFLVRLPAGELPARAPLAQADPPRMRPLWMARLRKRYGANHVDLSTNRLYGKSRGYAGRYHWYAARSIPAGTFLVDLSGRLVGAFVHERTEDDERRRLEASRGYGSPSLSYRLFTISELRSLLSDPQAHADPKIRVKPKTLAKRRAWLGVEFVPVTPDLAEMLGVQTPTKDGQLGFLINAVYADSPAQKMKLKVGDILLKLQAPTMPYPLELAGRFARDRYDYSRGWYPSSSDTGPAAPTWKQRTNFLTRALDAIGVDKTVKLTYCRADDEGAGKAVTVDYKIEMAPPDSDSAAKWQNRKLGLTVRDVTYEVRHALNLSPPAGVLVGKVESGSPTVVAKIFPNEVITRLDDLPLRSAGQMRELIAAAAAAGKDKVRLTILRLGRTRFADLAISEYDPADDEGIDEDGKNP